MIRIAIAEDNHFLQKAVAEKLSFFDDIICKFFAADGRELLEKLSADSGVDLILMDIEMPVMNGIEATSAVKQQHPDIRIIMLTVFDNDDNIFNSIKAGADGYLLKEINPHDLYHGIIETLNGGASMTPSIALKTLKLLRQTPGRPANVQDDLNLTAREVEVLEKLSRGLKYADIAESLFISTGTIRKHIENIYAKLQVHNKIEAIEKARNSNII